MFVPRTPGGELVRRLREAEVELSKITGEKIKLVERSGKMLKRILRTTNPTQESCSRQDCLPCNEAEEGGVGQCKLRNITYQTSCLDCLAQGKKVTYYGESSRTAYERGVEHMDDYQKEKEDSHMWKHSVTDHGVDKKVTFRMKVIKTHRSALQRQVHEAVLIEINSRKENILNSKGEYSRCKLPRLAVMYGDKESEDYLKESNRKSTVLSEMELEEEIDQRIQRKRRENVEDRSNRIEPASKRRRTGIRKNPEVTETERKRKLEVTDGGKEPRNKKQKSLEEGENVAGKVEIIEMFKNHQNLKNLQNKNQSQLTQIKEKLFPSKEKSPPPPLKLEERNQKKLFPIFTAHQPRGLSENKAQPSPSLSTHHHHPQTKNLRSAKFNSTKFGVKIQMKPIYYHFRPINPNKEKSPPKTQQKLKQNQ